MSGSNGNAYAYCVACGCVAVHNQSVRGPHHWIERRVDAEERRTLAGIICNVCMPRPDLICPTCDKIGQCTGADYVWQHRRKTRRELCRLRRERCPSCAAKETAASAP
ncbi:hypothetical protein EPO33_05530 [Patescibacteria group bacterium]|nr:MAG: hypothetical protein EPO33_05530 [Patescibacteria group bacterium]